MYAAAKYAKTKDYSVSMRSLADLLKIIWTVPAKVPPATPAPAVPSYIEKEMDARAAYLAARGPFEAQLKTYKDHKGRSGIEEFYLQMERDLAQADTEAGGGKYSTAVAVLQRAAPQFPAQTAIAVACETYLTAREAVAQTIADLKARPAAAQVLAQADALMATAAKQAQAKDFAAARASVAEAKKRTDDAKAAADAQDELDRLKDGGALGGIAADMDKAIKVYDDMRAHVAGKDPPVPSPPTWPAPMPRRKRPAPKEPNPPPMPVWRARASMPASRSWRRRCQRCWPPVPSPPIWARSRA